MNGKRAKMLRKLAGPTSPTQYKIIPNTVRNKFQNISPKLNADGTEELDAEGNVVYNKVEWQTRTIMMASGTRKIYKVLKNIYNNRTRGLPVNMQQA